MKEEFFSNFRKIREELGYDLEDVVERTKLHPSAIRAIESGDINSISRAYRKGFIKIYASFLGIKLEDELLDEVVTQDLPKKAPPKPKRKKEPPKPSKVFTPQVRRNIMFSVAVIIAFLIIVSLLSAIFSLIAYKFKTLSEKRKASVTTEELTKPAPAPTEAKSTKEIRVSLRIKQNCYVRVKQDGKIVFDGMLESGSLESWQAEKELDFKISDGSSVDVEVNDRLLPPLSKIRRAIKSLKVTTQGISIDK